MEHLFHSKKYPYLKWKYKSHFNSIVLFKNETDKIELKTDTIVDIFKNDDVTTIKIVGFTFSGFDSEPNGLLYEIYENGQWIVPKSLKKRKLSIRYHYNMFESMHVSNKLVPINITQMNKIKEL
tara:strand:+ start:325 stop:696 length:372 start_codon:yes stop_codon:yes gene_type:complete